MGKIFTRNNLKLKASKTRAFLDRNLVFVLLLSVAYFGGAILGFQRDNTELLEGQQEQREGRSQAVTEVKDEVIRQRRVISTQNDRIRHGS